jgi:hypothetical protein
MTRALVNGDGHKGSSVEFILMDNELQARKVKSHHAYIDRIKLNWCSLKNCAELKFLRPCRVLFFITVMHDRRFAQARIKM